MKPSELLDVLDERADTLRSPRDADTELLFTVLAHFFAADDKLDGREREVMRKLAPDIPNIKQYIEERQRRPLDLEALARAFPDQDDRRDIVEILEHAMWADYQVDEREWSFVDRLADALGVHRKRMSSLNL